MRPDASENSQISPSTIVGLPELLVAMHTSRQSCYKAGKSANIHASSRVIRGIPANASLCCALGLREAPLASAALRGFRWVLA